MTDKSDTSEVYFRLNVPKGVHFSEKLDENGDRSTNLFDDDNNGLEGPARGNFFDPIDEQRKKDLQIAEVMRENAEYEYKRTQETRAMVKETLEAVPGLLEDGTELVKMGLELLCWGKNTVYPKIKNEIIPSVKEKTAKLLHKIAPEVQSGERSNQEQEISLLTQFTPDLYMDMFWHDYSNFKINMSNEEAREHMLRISLLSAALAKELRAISNQIDVPDALKLDSDLQKKWQLALEQTATQNVVEAINSILQSDSPLLDEPGVLEALPLVHRSGSEDDSTLQLRLEDWQDTLDISTQQSQERDEISR